ncbi:MAG: Zn-dependent exopeptidase M28 [Firmicutes bacterium]|nr:Zn-dependent exopeptidase M28 [Bacillota bacterium]
MYSYDYLKKLCKFPHRGSCSENEKKASKSIYNEMNALGFKNIFIQKFKTPKDSMYNLPLQFGLLILISGVFLLLNIHSLYLSLFLLIPILMIVFEAKGSLVEINFFPKYDSQNIIAYDDYDDKLPTVVITGHYDTQKGSLLFSSKFQNKLQKLFNIAYLGFITIIISIITSTILDRVILPIIILDLIGIIITSIALLFLLYCNITGKYVNGANDNATGSALTMALSRHFKEKKFSDEDFNMIFLLTGSEENGSKGMKAFLRNWGKTLDKNNTYFLVIDNIGAGNITYLDGEGMIIKKHYNRFLKDLASKFKKEYDIRYNEKLLLPTDSLPVLNQGFKSISFLGKDEFGNIENYHWYTDTLDKISSKHMENTENFFIDYINLLFEKLSNKSNNRIFNNER